MTRRVIVTGTPGSGKTTLLDALAGEFEVVREAATDVVAALLAAGVAEPERDPAFLERITRLQLERARAGVAAVQLHDRSVFCTLALARFLGLAVPPVLAAALTPVRDAFAPWVVHVAPLPTPDPDPGAPHRRRRRPAIRRRTPRGLRRVRLRAARGTGGRRPDPRKPRQGGSHC